MGFELYLYSFRHNTIFVISFKRRNYDLIDFIQSDDCVRTTDTFYNNQNSIYDIPFACIIR